MKDIKNCKVASLNDNIAKIYNATRKLISDMRYLKRFDSIMDNLKYEDEAEEFFEEAIIPYLIDEVAPKGFGFGSHKMSGDIGFWEIGKNENYDVPYEGMVDRSDEFEDEDGHEEGDEDEDEEEEDDRSDEDIGDQENPESSVQPSESTSTAEILDENGRIVGTTDVKTRSVA